MSKRTAFLVLVAAVTAAGTSSLIYEVLWIRQLSFALGSTAVAVSIMLTAFLGGLALGSMLMGRVADKLARPLKAFTVVEIVAAITGLASIPAIAYAGRAYVLIATTVGMTGFWSMVLRGVFALVIMAIPATLFGMTFPLATVAGTRLVGSNTAVGVVSAASSFGSAIGALVCGLWLEPTLGLFASALVASGLNVLAAAAAMVAGLRLHGAHE
ncbi:MAG: hypothetical protein FWG78_00715 [Coriobacteriia bacterium]|nr:hypothetical protein [Coriobacteriia bacterium]